MTTKTKLFNVSGTIVPAPNAATAKRRVNLYAPQKTFGPIGQLRAVEVSGADVELERAAQEDAAAAFVKARRREALPLGLISAAKHLLGSLEEQGLKPAGISALRAELARFDNALRDIS